MWEIVPWESFGPLRLEMSLEECCAVLDDEPEVDGTLTDLLQRDTGGGMVYWFGKTLSRCQFSIDDRLVYA